MKLTIKIFIYLSFFINIAQATQVDKIAKEIAYTSQSMASDYLYLYNDEKNSIYKSRLKNSVHLLEENFRLLAKESSEADTKNILDFLSYSKDQIKETIEKDVSKESVLEILDYSDTLLEGAQSVIKSNEYNITKIEENRLSLLKLTKFYMAYKLGFDIQNSKNEIQKYLLTLDENIQDSASWNSYKRLIDSNELFFPNMISLLTKDLEGKL